MQTFRPILFQNLRRVALIMGLAIFVMFAYKASNEVSNKNIAAGNQRQKTLAANSQGHTSLVLYGLASESPASTVEAANNNVPEMAEYDEDNEETKTASTSELDTLNQTKRPKYGNKTFTTNNSFKSKRN